METSTLFRHAIFRVATCAALAGLCAMAGTAMAGTAGAATRTAPASHRGTARPASRTSARRQATGFANWPMLRGNPSHSGVSPETGINTTNASTLTAGWSASVGTRAYSSPAVVSLKALGGEPVVFVGGSSNFYAFPASGGAPLWTFPVKHIINASPAVLNGVVYFSSDDGTIYAVNAANGKLRCSYATHLVHRGVPRGRRRPRWLRAGDVYGQLPADGNTGRRMGNLRPRQHPRFLHQRLVVHRLYDSAPTGTWSPPAYGTNANGTPVVVFGSDDPDNSVYELNATTGAMLWTYRTNNTTADDDVGASPTISAPGVNGFADGVAYITGKDKITYAFDLTTGALIWQHALAVGTAGDVCGSSLVGNTLYLGSDTGVYALNATTGAQVWHVIPNRAFYASPAVIGPPGQQVLITASISGVVYALNLANGNTLWTHEADTAGIWASPAVSQGTIYIPGKDGQLMTFAPSGANR